MPHPKRSLIAEERALANSFAEFARRLQRSQHPHFRHDLEPDVGEATLVRQDAPPTTMNQLVKRLTGRDIRTYIADITRILTRRRVKPL